MVFYNNCVILLLQSSTNMLLNICFDWCLPLFFFINSKSVLNCSFNWKQKILKLFFAFLVKSKISIQLILNPSLCLLYTRIYSVFYWNIGKIQLVPIIIKFEKVYRKVTAFQIKWEIHNWLAFCENAYGVQYLFLFFAKMFGMYSIQWQTWKILLLKLCHHDL